MFGIMKQGLDAVSRSLWGLAYKWWIRPQLEAGIKAHELRNGIPSGIDAYRAKFAAGPVGTWVSSIDFCPGPVDVWDFYPDGTGRLAEYGGGDNVIAFTWRSLDEESIEMTVIDWGNLAENATEADRALYTVPCTSVVRYNFRQEDDPRAYSPSIVMSLWPDDDEFHFWVFGGLHFQGDIK